MPRSLSLLPTLTKVASLLSLFLSVLPLPARSQTGPVFVASWGQCCLNSPYGIALGHDGFAYVSDQFNYRVAKFTLDGQFVTAWGSQGSGPGQFGRTIGIALDGHGRVYVVDYDNSRIQAFTTEGAYVTQWGSAGSADGKFSAPRRLVVDAAGFVHVTDFGNNRIQTFTRDGAFVSKWAVGEVQQPSSIAISPSGYFFITEESGDADRVAIYDPSHIRVGQFGGPGQEPGQFAGPTGIAVDAFGRVLVADHNNNRIQEFTSSGQFVRTWGTGGSGPGEFLAPMDVAVSETGDVYVVDLANNRIQVFRDSAVQTAALSWGELKARYR